MPCGSTTMIGSTAAGDVVTAYSHTPYPSAPAVETAISDVPSPFTSGAAKVSHPTGEKQSVSSGAVASTVPFPSRSAPTNRCPSPGFGQPSVAFVNTYAFPGAPATVMGIDMTSQIGNPSPRSGGGCVGVGMVPGMGSVRKARPSATNAPVVPASTTTTNPTVPALLTPARRRLRAARCSTRSPSPVGFGAASRIRVLSWSSMLGMAVLLIGVLNERERIRQMRARLEQLALHRALARPHLLRDLLRAEIEDVAQHGDLPLASGKVCQRAGDIDAI